MKDERQSKEESQVLWKLELDSIGKLDLTPEHRRLVAIVSSKIEDYSLTYAEYIKDIADYLAEVAEDAEPKVVINEMINALINKYTNGEEVRSEQD